MSRSYKKLERVLKLEAKQGYQNKAVVGGIRQFATFWVEQARADAASEADKAFVEQTAEVLMSYNRLSGTEARADAVDNLLARLQQQQGRTKVAKPRPAAPPAKQTAAAAPAPEATPAPPAAPAAPEASVADKLVAPAPPPNGAAAAAAAETEDDEAVEPHYSADPAALAADVTILHGVGPQIAARLAKLGATTIADLLTLYPRRYDDYSQLKPIQRLQYGEQVTVLGTVWEVRARRSRGNRNILQVVIGDGSGRLNITWFNQPWLANKLSAGMQIAVSGKIDQYLGRLVLQNPEWEPVSRDMLKTGRINPVYPLTDGLSSNKMRDIMQKTVSRYARKVLDPVPQPIRQRQRLPHLTEAIYQIHFPDTQEKLHAARRRLVFDELFLLQLGMLGNRQRWQSEGAFPVSQDLPLLTQFIDSLPYQLTGAQQRVIDEIGADMARAVPMSRLLQGDVGAGKTVVAAAAMIMAVGSGGQAALMAPTEILAEQHFQGLHDLLVNLGIEPALLTGSTSSSDKEAIYAGLASGVIQVVIGTHALIQENVHFHNLALAVVDEQHRFGVEQRRALRDKGNRVGPDGAEIVQAPHLLAMSATPIPRTLALSLYGDLDLSILDEMPPGRQEIRTNWLQPRERERAYSFVRGQIDQGRQAYVVCPLVEESDSLEEKAAVTEYERLQNEIFPDLKLGLVHGRMKQAEKEAAMRAFYAGETDILVATAVIEVGVDVPNSTVMLIEGANRFGLAQLHQFRGRVGRGQHQSYCLLMADTNSAEAEERLKALEQTNDGFALAEKDLEIRGPGEFFGVRQSGIPELRLASLLDLAMVETARGEAIEIFDADPMLTAPEHEALRERVAQFWGDASSGS